MSDLVPTYSGEIVRVPFHGSALITAKIEGRRHIVFKPAVEAIGLSYPAQIAKLKGRSWACVATVAMQLPGDTQSRAHTTVDVRTFLMLLATIEEGRVAERVRPLLRAYQSEVADAIEAYWTKGSTLRPTGTETSNAPAVVEVPFDDYEKLIAGGQQLLAKLRAQDKQIEAQEAELAETHAYVEHLEPDAEAFRNIVKDDGRDFDVRTTARFLCRSDRRIRIGRDQLFAKLKELKLLDRWGEPYSHQKRYVTSMPRTYPHPRTGERIPTKGSSPGHLGRVELDPPPITRRDREGGGREGIAEAS